MTTTVTFKNYTFNVNLEQNFVDMVIPSTVDVWELTHQDNAKMWEIFNDFLKSEHVPSNFIGDTNIVQLS